MRPTPTDDHHRHPDVTVPTFGGRKLSLPRHWFRLAVDEAKAVATARPIGAVVTRMATMPETVALVGGGRVGTALAAALRAAGRPVIGPLGRGEIVDADVVLLCVPDSRIAEVAAQFSGRAQYIGHVSGATPINRLASAGVPMFGLHPAQTFAGQDGPERFHDVGAAVSGSTPAALRVARELATAVGMRPFEIDEAHRGAYHAAACVASNFLITIADAAEQLAAGAGLAPEQSRELFGPLVRTTVQNWFERGPRAALTGPVERGDTATVDRQRVAVHEVAPGLSDLFEALVVATETLAAHSDRPPTPTTPHSAENTGPTREITR